MENKVLLKDCLLRIRRRLKIIEKLITCIQLLLQNLKIKSEIVNIFDFAMNLEIDFKIII